MRHFIIFGGSIIFFVFSSLNILCINPQVSDHDLDYFRDNFEMGKNFLDARQYAKAIEYYEKSKEEDSEYGWYSEYMIGKCYQYMNDWPNALKYYHSSFERRPIRLEPLFDIAYYHFSIGELDKAYDYLKICEKIPYPSDDHLDVNDAIYKYKVKEYLSICIPHFHTKTLALNYIDKIVFNSEIESGAKHANLVRSVDYLENINIATFIPIQPLTPLLCDWSSERYKPCNPSIFKVNDGYVVNCRSVNYVQWCPGHLIVDGSGKTKTKNMFIKYDKQFNKVFEKCVNEAPSLAIFNNYTQGLEDLRIFEFNDQIYFTATTCQLHQRNIPKICLGKFECNNLDESVNVDNIQLLHGPNYDRPEKNWMPFVVNGELFAIYSLSPFIIYKPCISTGLCPEFINKDLGFDFTRLSGSASPIPFDDGYLLMVHEGIWNYRRYYLHRFFYFDKNFELKKYSKPFSFKHKGIEMCCGMTLDHEEQNLIMAIGLEDREAYLCLVNVEDIRLLLKDINELKN